MEQFAIDQEASPLFRLIDAGDDFDDGAFATAVLAGQAVYLAFIQRQADPIQSQHAGKLFTDVFKRDECAAVHGQYSAGRPRRGVVV
ncbi:hypothetical protein N4G58_12830 [Edwardsiella piscicida]|nr:hypothetical protein N4G58_12830 [Edwardsiella piscicida]